MHSTRLRRPHTPAHHPALALLILLTLALAPLAGAPGRARAQSACADLARVTSWSGTLGISHDTAASWTEPLGPYGATITYDSSSSLLVESSVAATPANPSAPQSVQLRPAGRIVNEQRATQDRGWGPQQILDYTVSGSAALAPSIIQLTINPVTCEASMGLTYNSQSGFTNGWGRQFNLQINVQGQRLPVSAGPGGLSISGSAPLLVPYGPWTVDQLPASGVVAMRSGYPGTDGLIGQYYHHANMLPFGEPGTLTWSFTGAIPAAPGPVALEGLELQRWDRPGGRWVALPAGGSVAAGSPVRVVSRLRNPGPGPQTVELRIADTLSGATIGCPPFVTVPPTGAGAAHEAACEWDTSGLGWGGGDRPQAAPPRAIRATLTPAGAAPSSRDAAVVVRPRPLLFVPGIAGTYAAVIGGGAAMLDKPWLMQRGVPPHMLQIDPLIRSYDGLLKTLENSGYTPGQDLFVVNYDWRLVPGPADGEYDGVVRGLSAESISDDSFQYGVDYLGRALREATAVWKRDYGVPLDEVDLIAHSTGGLVARTYIQSEAYGEEYDSIIDARLPAVRNFVSVGVPHRGASKAWNPLHDNWGVDASFQAVLSKIVNRAFQKVDAGGETIGGPDYPIDIRDTRDGSGSPTPERFIRRYIPTINSLLGTYPFLDRGAGVFADVNDGNLANRLLLDLNNGADITPGRDPNLFLSRTRLTAIGGVNPDEPTPTYVRQRLGPADDVLAPFADFFANDAAEGELYFEDVRVPLGGDGTVPTLSGVGPFEGDPRARVLTFQEGLNTQAPVGHTQLTDNPDVQRAILSTLGAPVRDANLIALGRTDLYNVTSIILDPVQGFLADGEGRRLGWSEATGPLQEIPNSVWFGDGDGFGLVFGPISGTPRLELRGLDGPYYAQVTRVTAEGELGGATLAGPHLARDETRSAPAPLASEAALYRARQVGLRVWIERHVARAGLGDHDPDGDGWALVGRTNGAADNGELRAFFIYEGAPYAVVFNRNKGKGDRCIVVTPRMLSRVRKGQTRLVARVVDPLPCSAVHGGDGAPAAGPWR